MFVDNARISLAWENADGYAEALLEFVMITHEKESIHNLKVHTDAHKPQKY
jgi:hypothetical protein